MGRRIVKILNLKVFFLLLGVAALSACATGMSADDCAGADWAALGEADGGLGEPLERFGKRAEQCAEYGFSPDRAAYESGRAAGLARYCSPEGGFDAGRSGAPYRGVCLPQDESQFLVEYDLWATALRISENL